MSRRVPRPSSLVSGVRFVQCDIRDGRRLQAIIPRESAVFHLAAAKRGRNAEVWETNVEGTANVVRAAIDAESRRVVIFSSVHVYGPARPEHIADENDPAHPRGSYACSKLEAEIRALAIAEERGYPSVVLLRPGAVYGPCVPGAYMRLLHVLRVAPRMRMPLAAVRRTLVYVDDLVDAALAVAQGNSVDGRTFNVTDGAVHRIEEIVDAVRRALGRPGSMKGVGGALLGAAADAVDVLFHAALRLPSPVHAGLAHWGSDIAADGTRISRETPFAPRVDLVEGSRRVAAYMESSRRGGEGSYYDG